MVTSGREMPQASSTKLTPMCVNAFYGCSHAAVVNAVGSLAAARNGLRNDW